MLGMVLSSSERFCVLCMQTSYSVYLTMQEAGVIERCLWHGLQCTVKDSRDCATSSACWSVSTSVLTLS